MMISMNKSIFILSILFLASCAKDSSSPAVAAATPAIPLSCAGQVAGKSWKVNNPTVTHIYNLTSSCAGTIPHCNAEFNYDITNSDQTGKIGLMKIWVLKSSENQSESCPYANSYSECTFEIAPHPTFGYEQLKTVCNGNFNTYFVPNGVL